MFDEYKKTVHLKLDVCDINDISVDVKYNDANIIYSTIDCLCNYNRSDIDVLLTDEGCASNFDMYYVFDVNGGEYEIILLGSEIYKLYQGKTIITNIIIKDEV